MCVRVCACVCVVIVGEDAFARPTTLKTNCSGSMGSSELTISDASTLRGVAYAAEESARRQSDRERAAAVRRMSAFRPLKEERARVK